MHRVNARKRQKLYLRIFAYGVLILLTVITTALLLLVALGYRLDGDSGHVVRSGLLLVDSRPIAAQVKINNEDKQDETPSRFVLPAGPYQLSLAANGYRDWVKAVELEASSVEDVHYARLIPEEIVLKKILSTEKPAMVSQSSDRKQILIYANQLSLQLIELDPKQPKSTTLSLPSSFMRQSGTLGSLEVVEWADDNRHVLLEQTVNSQKRLLSIDTEQPASSRDITSIYGANTPGNARYATENGDQLFGLKNNQLRSYDPEDQGNRLLLGKVASYEPFDENTVSFVRQSDNGKQLEAGLLSKDVASVVHSAPIKKGTSLTSYGQYDDDFYLAVQLAGETRVTLYRNPLKKPILAKQLPYSFLPIKNVKELSFSGNSQFLLSRSGNNLVTYDFEHDKKHQPNFKQDLAGVDWIDSHHLLVRDTKNINYMMDYDGANKYELVDSSIGAVLFSSDYETLYRFRPNKNTTELQAASLLVAQD